MGKRTRNQKDLLVVAGSSTHEYLFASPPLRGDKKEQILGMRPSFVEYDTHGGIREVGFPKIYFGHGGQGNFCDFVDELAEQWGAHAFNTLYGVTPQVGPGSIVHLIVNGVMDNTQRAMVLEDEALLSKADKVVSSI